MVAKMPVDASGRGGTVSEQTCSVRRYGRSVAAACVRVLIGYIIMLIMISGCVSTTGRSIDHTKVAQIQKGVSTRADVERLLGRPDQIMTNSGITTLSYFHMVTDVTRSMIPVVGLLAGGADMKTDHVTIMIGSDGKVTEVVEGASEQTMNTGILNTDR